MLESTKSDSDKIGYTNAIEDIHNNFKIHGKLLLLLWKLDVIPKEWYYILQKDFEQNTWTKIRDGE